MEGGTTRFERAAHGALILSAAWAIRLAFKSYKLSQPQLPSPQKKRPHELPPSGEEPLPGMTAFDSWMQNGGFDMDRVGLDPES